MFDLDQSIAEWRKQMLAAGIRTPVPLDELESHLRDDVERGMGSGLDARQAFAVAVRRMGAATELNSEFENVRSNPANPHEPMKQKLRNFLASTSPHEALKKTIRNILVIIAVMAIGAGFFLPALAEWRAHETLPGLGIAFLLIGAIIFLFGAACRIIGVITSLKGRPKA